MKTLILSFRTEHATSWLRQNVPHDQWNNYIKVRFPSDALGYQIADVICLHGFDSRKEWSMIRDTVNARLMSNPKQLSQVNAKRFLRGEAALPLV